MDESTYISYESAPSQWTLLDGSKPPAKKYFENPVYNADLKAFKGDIVWGENTFGGAAKWEYEMVFSDDSMKIESGYVKTYDIAGSLTGTDNFG